MLRRLYSNKQYIVGFDLFLRAVITNSNVDLGDLATIFPRPAYSYDPTHYSFDEVMTQLATSLKLIIEFHNPDNPSR